MKSLILLLQCVLIDLGTWCRTSTSRDLKTITARIEHEGMSFLTISLPQFGKDFERSLDLGVVTPSSFCGFHREKGLPRFLGGFLEQVFDRETGILLDEPSSAAIRAVRQISLLYGKILLPCSDARRRKAYHGFVQSNEETREADAAVRPDLVDAFNRIGSLLWARAFDVADWKVYHSEIVPKHGPGATAERLRGNAKWVQREWTERLEQVFPSGSYLVANRRGVESLASVRILEPGSERPVRVISVPKSLKTPRIIAIEPTCMQYMQQGILAAIRAGLQECDNSWNLVGWGSQVPNQHLACKGSSNGALATLDLSEASDRVSNRHVRGLLHNHRFLSEAVDSSRSRKADVPEHGLLDLHRFASMGSALTFPMESMVFMTIIFVAIESELGRKLSHDDVKSFVGKVRVYGDDIIVPVRFVHSVIRHLEAFGLKVNADKSFWTGKFRESCGAEFYNGDDVSVVRCRRELPTSLTDSTELVSAVALRNHLYKGGLWGAAGFLDDLIRDIMPFPVVDERAPVLGRHSFLGPDLSGKLHHDTHRPLVRGATVRALIPDSHLDGEGALLKCLTRLEMLNQTLGIEPDQYVSSDDPRDLPVAGAEHLLKSGRPVSFDIKIRYASST